jgi:amicyanin
MMVIGLLALTTLLIFAVACQSSGATPTTSPPSSPSPTSTAGLTAVKISGLAFDPANITVPMGTVVTWTNLDSVPHTVTSDTGVFESGTLSRNATFSYTFNSRGTFSYSCTIHPSMKGKVVVE